MSELKIKAKMVELHLAILKEIRNADREKLVELIYDQFSEETVEKLIDIYSTEAEMMRLLIDISICEIEGYIKYHSKKIKPRQPKSLK